MTPTSNYPKVKLNSLCGPPDSWRELKTNKNLKTCISPSIDNIATDFINDIRFKILPKVKFNTLFVPSDSWRFKSLVILSHRIAGEKYKQTKTCIASSVGNIATDFTNDIRFKFLPKVKFNTLFVPSDSWRFKSLVIMSHPIAGEKYKQTKTCVAPSIDNIATDFRNDIRFKILPKVKFDTLFVLSDSWRCKSLEIPPNPIAGEKYKQTKTCIAPSIDNIATDFRNDTNIKLSEG